MSKFHNFIIICTFFSFNFAMAENKITHNEPTWETRFEKFLNEVKENSIRNCDWTKVDWKKYSNKQLKQLPITDEERLISAITTSLQDLKDKHSSIILKNKQAITPKTKPSISIQNGVGIINMPELAIEYDGEKEEISTDATLNEPWVKNFHIQLEKESTKVSKGWIIDLTENHGGNMFPMLAALSRFYSNPLLGGFFSCSSNGDKHKTLISFDGKSFIFNDEDHMSYDTTFPINQNSLPVVVLIGKGTVSSGEFVALALQRQPNVTLIGELSFGLATGNIIITLPDKLGYYALTSSYDLNTNNEPLYEEKVTPEIIVLGSKAKLLETAKEIILNNQPSSGKDKAELAAKFTDLSQKTESHPDNDLSCLGAENPPAEEL